MSMALMQFNPDEVELLRKTITSGATNDQLALFMQVCRQTGLNPFARQIYAVIRNERQKDGSYEKKMTIQTSIDGYRLLAQRSNEYAGQEGPFWLDAETKEWTDYWLKDTPPAAAKVGVMRRGFVQPIYAVARFESYAARAYNKDTRKYDGDLANLWAKMPELMIAKVAEALALRRAFPAELSGLYTAEEMAQADRPLPSVSSAVVTVESALSDEQRERLNALLEQGKEKGLYQKRSQMAQYISEVLEQPITSEQFATLTEDDFVRVEYAIAGASGLNGAA